LNNLVSKLNKLLFEELGEMISEEDFKRVENLLLDALKFDQRNYKEHVPVEVKIKLKSKQKKFRDIFSGQIFELYLEEIEKYTYGVVLEGNLTLDKSDDLVIGYLNSFTDVPLSVTKIYELINDKYFSYIANSGISSILNYRWKFVGSYPEQIIDRNELANIEYATKFMDKFYKSVGKSDLPIANCQKISEEEYKKIPNPHGIVGANIIEKDLISIARSGSIHC
jgi:hypothetical protein